MSKLDPLIKKLETKLSRLAKRVKGDTDVLFTKDKAMLFVELWNEVARYQALVDSSSIFNEPIIKEATKAAHEYSSKITFVVLSKHDESVFLGTYLAIRLINISVKYNRQHQLL